MKSKYYYKLWQPKHKTFNIYEVSVPKSKWNMGTTSTCLKCAKDKKLNGMVEKIFESLLRAENGTVLGDFKEISKAEVFAECL